MRRDPRDPFPCDARATRQPAAGPPLADELPPYLRQTYGWAYLSPAFVPWLDRQWVVNAILWGNARRLMDAAIASFHPGERVLQAACVYGDFSPRLADRLGPTGQLDIVDVACLQLARTATKLAGRRCRLQQADLRRPGSVGPGYDGVCCFFLLHEVPATDRPALVDNLLGAVRPGGRIVFVDYHAPARWHPLGLPMRGVFRTLEPYAASLLDTRLERIGRDSEAFDWVTASFFGGLYQKVVGTRRPGR